MNEGIKEEGQGTEAEEISYDVSAVRMAILKCGNQGSQRLKNLSKSQSQGVKMEFECRQLDSKTGII